MRDLGGAIVAGLKAPVARWRLVLLLWLARLVPAVLFFSVPVFAAIDRRVGGSPDGARLLDAGADTTGFSSAVVADLVRTDLAATVDNVFWLVCFTWVVVTLLAGGITARLIHGREASGLFLAECGRYAGRFLRLGLVAAACLYAVDVLVNGVLHEVHARGAKLHHTQHFALEKTFVRGALFLAFWQLVGMVHAYARIDMVVNERRSAALAFLRGLGILVARLPKLLLLEAALLVAAGAAAAAAWLLGDALAPRTDATWLSMGLFLAALAAGSYLRTGIELGTLDARCRLLAPAPPPSAPSRIETPVASPPPWDDEGDIPLPA